MKYTKTKKNNQYTLKITLDQKEWEEAIEKAYQKTKSKYNIQGFRKGKAPRQYIEKVYGTGVFYEDAIDGCFSKYYFEILDKEKEIEPIDLPTIDIEDISDKGVTIVAVVESKPPVELGDYKGLTIPKKEIKVTAKEVNAELEKMRERGARFVEKDEAIVQGDFAVIDFEGKIDGVAFAGGTAKDYELEIGSHSFIDTFEDQLVGLKKGDSKDVNVKFPENYHVEDLKCKPAVFAVTIKDVKSKELPALDDKFAADSSEFNTLEELKADIKHRLTHEAEHKAEHEQEQALIDAITNNAKVDIPEIMVRRQVEDYIKDFEYRLSYQGIKLADYVKYMGTTIEDLKKSREEDAKMTVKTRLVLEKIIEDNKIKVTPTDVLKKVNETRDPKLTIEDLKKEIPDEQLAYIENGILLNKLLKFLKENNTL